jgi:carbamoyltransferase
VGGIRASKYEAIMKILGINETTHDAAACIVYKGSILFAGHAERYSKIKNDCDINPDLLRDAYRYGTPDQVAYYEKSWLKKARVKLYGGFGGTKPKYKELWTGELPSKTFSHHYSHAAAGYYTSYFKDAVIVVLDAIGEFVTSSVWLGENENIKSVKKWQYPFSYGLFYSAFTDLIGLKPNQEEYIMMGMAAYGDPSLYYDKVSQYFPSTYKQKYNFHKGINDWNSIILDSDRFHIAAAVQMVYEERLYEFMRDVKSMTGKDNLVFMGGCALNSKANTGLWKIFNDIWIMPNPGDAGSSLGAAAALYGRHLHWEGPYLGHNIGKRYPTKKIFDEIMSNGIAAVASGRAEFGPRSLGNRSILADPRDPSIRDKVNNIKQRELFRPFAPVVMEEHASEWFDMDYSSPYMQYTPLCLKPELIPSVVHHDGTSRVQTVNKKQHPGLYKLLEMFYNETGVPILLNTSLNIKGQPLLNDESDILEWENTYKTRIIR